MNASSSVAPQPAPVVAASLLEGLAGYRLSRVAASFIADFRRAMDGTGMRPVLFSMLAIVAENPGINQTSLGRMLGVQRANLVPLVNELLERALVERQTAANDRRAFALVLTDAGRGMLDECVGRVSVHEERMLAPLTRGERVILLDLLTRLQDD